jgi:hypothetical protein
MISLLTLCPPFVILLWVWFAAVLIFFILFHIWDLLSLSSFKEKKIVWFILIYEQFFVLRFDFYFLGKIVILVAALICLWYQYVSDWNLEPTWNSICIFQFISLGYLLPTRPKLFAKIYEMYKVLKANSLKSGMHLENHMVNSSIRKFYSENIWVLLPKNKIVCILNAWMHWTLIWLRCCF